MNKTLALLLLAASSCVAVDCISRPFTNDSAALERTLDELNGPLWRDYIDGFQRKLGNEAVGKMLLEIVEPIFDTACTQTFRERENRICGMGIAAMRRLKLTNTLPFLERAVLTGSREFSQDAFDAYGEITQYDESFIDLGDRAAGNSALSRRYYISRMDVLFWNICSGEIQVTPESKLRIVIRVVGNPSDYYVDFPITDKMLLSDFPSYTNSVERLAALSAFLGNENTPPDVQAKYEPERDRLKALPPESLVRVTDELEAQLDALLKAAERKRKIEQVKKYAVPAGAAVLVLGVLAVLFNRHPRR